MAILTFNILGVGVVDAVPRIVLISSNDNFATITAPGYLNNTLTSGQELTANDEYHIKYVHAGNPAFGIFTPSISNGIYTLLEAFPGLPSSNTVVGDIATFATTNGSIGDSGINVSSTNGNLTLYAPIQALGNAQLLVTNPTPLESGSTTRIFRTNLNAAGGAGIDSNDISLDFLTYNDGDGNYSSTIQILNNFWSNDWNFITRVPGAGTGTNYHTVFAFTGGGEVSTLHNILDNGINGGATFAGTIRISPTTNQLILGTTNTTTISAIAPAASRTYTLPDALANANISLSTQTSVTQATSITTGVTLTGTTGNITTVSSTLAAGATAAFVVTDTFYTSANQVVSVVISNGTNTASLPYAYVSALTPGSNQFTVNICNIGPTNAFNGTLIVQVRIS